MLRLPTSESVRAIFLHRHAVEVVVLGHQKSGTTAIAALLARMAGKGYSNDPLYRVDWGGGSAAEAVMANPESLTDLVRSRRRMFCRPFLKDPDLSFIIPACRRTFDRARFVFVVRDPRDTVRSIADRLGLTARDLLCPADASKLPNRHWSLILAGCLPEVRGNSIAEAIAMRWRIAVRHFYDNSDGIVLLRYEDFLADRIGSLARCLGDLGIKQRQDITPWLETRYQPKGDASMGLQDRLGNECVRFIEEICSVELHKMGYPLRR